MPWPGLMPANLLTTVYESCLRRQAEEDLRSVSDSEHDRGRGQGRFSFAGGPVWGRPLPACTCVVYCFEAPLVPASFVVHAGRSDEPSSGRGFRRRGEVEVSDCESEGGSRPYWVQAGIGLLRTLKQPYHDYPGNEAAFAGLLLLATHCNWGWRRLQ